MSLLLPLSARPETRSSFNALTRATYVSRFRFCLWWAAEHLRCTFALAWLLCKDFLQILHNRMCALSRATNRMRPKAVCIADQAERTFIVVGSTMSYQRCEMNLVAARSLPCHMPGCDQVILYN